MKANNHPLVRDLRHLLNKHGLRGAVLLGITDKNTISASAGVDVETCDALGPVICDENTRFIYMEMQEAIERAERKRAPADQIDLDELWENS